MKIDKEIYIDLFTFYIEKEGLPAFAAFDKIIDQIEKDIERIVVHFNRRIDQLQGKNKRQVLSFFSSEIKTNIPAEYFICFMRNYKLVNELFMELLDPSYLDCLIMKVQKGEVELKETGIIPKLDELFSHKRFYASEEERKICHTFIPILIKIREIIEKYTDEIYKNYYISERSRFNVAEVIRGIFYQNFYDHRLVINSTFQSGLKYYLSFSDVSLSQTTLYSYKEKALPGILSRLENELSEKEQNDLYILIQYVDEAKLKRDRLKSLINYMEDPFYKNGPYSIC